MEKLLTLQEVLEFVTVSYSTIRRWVSTGTFPQPLNGRGKKLLWTQSAIESWIDRQSTPVSPSEVAPPRKQRQAEKSFLERQEAARAALERHRKSK